MSIATATEQTYITSLLKAQRAYFSTGATKSVDFRKEQLKKLRKAIEQHEGRILEALYMDLHKHEFEGFGTEIGIVLAELDQAISQIDRWARPKTVGTPLFHFMGTSFIQPEPYGTVLIVAPWNYPFQLLFAPLVGAIAAGNTAVLKPSEYSENTTRVMAEIIEEIYDPTYVAVVEGGPEVSQELLQQRWDYIFFTGSPQVGRAVYMAAAKHLTPVTLELGGKSPCIVDKDVNIELAGKRIAWGKFINAGQTCIAPDYILVHRDRKDALIDALRKGIDSLYGKDPQASADYGRIINERHYLRLASYLQDGSVAIGGETDALTRYIAPTILDNVSLDSPVMQEEIFGPILPVIAVNDMDEAIAFVNARPKPLSLYAFSDRSRTLDSILENTSSGGVCLNDTLMHIANSAMPFGGVGESGIGAYHGKASFDVFSHAKGVFKRSTLIDPPLRYAPYNKFGLGPLRKILKWTL